MTWADRLHAIHLGLLPPAHRQLPWQELPPAHSDPPLLLSLVLQEPLDPSVEPPLLQSLSGWPGGWELLVSTPDPAALAAPRLWLQGAVRGFSADTPGELWQRAPALAGGRWLLRVSGTQTLPSSLLSALNAHAPWPQPGRWLLLQPNSLLQPNILLLAYERQALWSRTALTIAQQPLPLIAGGPAAPIPEPITSLQLPGDRLLLGAGPAPESALLNSAIAQLQASAHPLLLLAAANGQPQWLLVEAAFWRELGPAAANPLQRAEALGHPLLLAPQRLPLPASGSGWLQPLTNPHLARGRQLLLVPSRGAQQPEDLPEPERWYWQARQRAGFRLLLLPNRSSMRPARLWRQLHSEGHLQGIEWVSWLPSGSLISMDGLDQLRASAPARPRLIDRRRHQPRPEGPRPWPLAGFTHPCSAPPQSWLDTTSLLEGVILGWPG